MLNRCISLDSTYIPAYLELYKLYRTNGIAAGRVLRNAVRINHSNDRLRSKFAYWLMDNGKWREYIDIRRNSHSPDIR